MRAIDLINVYAGHTICKIVIEENGNNIFTFEPETDATPVETYCRFETIAINERCLNYSVKCFEVVNHETENYYSILYITV